MTKKNGEILPVLSDASRKYDHCCVFEVMCIFPPTSFRMETFIDLSK